MDSLPHARSRRKGFLPEQLARFHCMQSSSKMQIGVFGIMVPVWKLWKRLTRVLHNISIVEFVVFEPRGCSMRDSGSFVVRICLRLTGSVPPATDTTMQADQCVSSDLPNGVGCFSRVCLGFLRNIGLRMHGTANCGQKALDG